MSSLKQKKYLSEVVVVVVRVLWIGEEETPRWCETSLFVVLIMKSLMMKTRKTKKKKKKEEEEEERLLRNLHPEDSYNWEKETLLEGPRHCFRLGHHHLHRHSLRVGDCWRKWKYRRRGVDSAATERAEEAGRRPEGRASAGGSENSCPSIAVVALLFVVVVVVVVRAAAAAALLVVVVRRKRRRPSRATESTNRRPHQSHREEGDLTQRCSASLWDQVWQIYQRTWVFGKGKRDELDEKEQKEKFKLFI